MIQTHTKIMMTLVLATALLLTFAFAGQVMAKSNLSDSNTSNEGSGSGSGGVNVTTTEDDSDNFVKVKLNPTSMTSKDGVAKYEFSVRDKHSPGGCTNATDSEPALCKDPAISEYTLFFESESGLEGKFLDGDKAVKAITLLGGATKELTLVVSLNKEAVPTGKVSTDKISDPMLGKPEFVGKIYEFKAGAKSQNAEDTAKGNLIVNDNKPEPRNNILFHGNGFALSNDNAEGLEMYIFLSEKSDSAIINGKVRINDESYSATGSFLVHTQNSVVEGDMVFPEFQVDLYNPKTDKKIGSLQWSIRDYNRFSLLTGTLDFKDRTWKVSAMGKKEFGIVTEIQVDASSTSTTEVASVDDKIIISKKSESTESSEAVKSESEISVTPVEFRKSKFLGFIPNPWGKQEVVVEVTHGDKTTLVSIKEKESKSVEGYDIKASSVTSDGKVSFDIKKSDK